MADQSNSDLVDLIYETAFDPSLWTPVMERFADLIGGNAGWLSQLSTADGSGGDEADPMSRVDPQWPRAYLEHYAGCNLLHNVADPNAYMRQWTPRILTDEDWMPKETLLRSEFYNDFLRPQDNHAVMMIRLAARGMEIATLNIGRSARNGQFETQDLELAASFHPHFIRAFDLGRRFAATRRLSNDLAAVLDGSPHGLFLLDQTGAVRHVNRVGEALTRELNGLRIKDGRLAAPSPDDTRRLLGLVGAVAERDSGAGGSMAIATPARRLPLSVTVAPARSDRFSSFGAGCAALVCVTDLEAGVSLPQQRLRELFGLTAAETRVALGILEGQAPRAISEAFGVSPHTVHVQLARVFDKTGTSRQAELVRLMMRVIGAGLG